MSRRHSADRHGGYERGREPARTAANIPADIPATGDADAPCPGDCNRAFRAAEAAYLDAMRAWREGEPRPEDHDVPFWPGRPTWCTSGWAMGLDRYGQVTTVETHRGCTERIEAALRNLRLLWRDVPTSGRLSVAEPSERRGTGEAPSPSPAFDEADAFTRWHTHLAKELAERLGHKPPRSHLALRYLAEHVSPLLSMQDAEQIGRDIMSWERRLRSIVGAQKVTRMPGTCIACDARGTLRHGNAEDLVKCISCRAAWDWDTYHRDIVGRDDHDGLGSGSRRTA